MARKYIDCRETPETAKMCSIAISADTDEELIEAVVQHGVQVHGMEDTPELREQLKDAIKEGEPGE
jgi:predicted small metal-binding protein